MVKVNLFSKCERALAKEHPPQVSILLANWFWRSSKCVKAYNKQHTMNSEPWKMNHNQWIMYDNRQILHDNKQGMATDRQQTIHDDRQTMYEYKQWSLHIKPLAQLTD